MNYLPAPFSFTHIIVFIILEVISLIILGMRVEKLDIQIIDAIAISILTFFWPFVTMFLVFTFPIVMLASGCIWIGGKIRESLENIREK